MRMKYEDIKEKWNQHCTISFEDFLTSHGVSLEHYPMIVLADLSKNTYSMLRDEDFLFSDIEDTGCYDDLIDDNMENIHPNYQQKFYESFSREHLLCTYEQGKEDVYAEVYQKNQQGNYQWVSIQVLRVDSEDGSIKHVCINRILDLKNEKSNQ